MKKIFLLAIAALSLAACDNNEDNPQSSGEAAIISASIGDNVISRAVDSDWNKNDEIGITSTVGDVIGPFINFKYTTEKGDGKFTGDDPIFFYKPMVLTAYYPYTGDKETLPGVDGVIPADTRADKQTDANRPKIDFLWDSKTGAGKKDFSVSNPEVKFVFAHKMSKISFTFQSSEPDYSKEDPTIMISDGVDVATMISYNIAGLGVEGTFDTNTGICAIDESKGREGLKISFPKAETKLKMREMSPLIVFPQINPAGYTLHITTDELKEGSPTQNYKCAISFSGNEIKAGYHYIFTILVTRRGLIVGNLTIEPWVSTEKFVIATIDGGENGFKEN